MTPISKGIGDLLIDTSIHQGSKICLHYRELAVEPGPIFTSLRFLFLG
jgi:hypothetical protein